MMAVRLGSGRVNYGILAIALVWSLFIYYVFSSSLSDCLDESVRLRMAVERKDRFLELLRDQNDDLKNKLSKLHEASKRDDEQKTGRERMFLVKELPFSSNGTV